MKELKVTEVMIPLAEYATVSEEATLLEAVFALEEAQELFEDGRDRHRSVLIFDQQKKIVGKISQLDVISALEPKYEELHQGDGLSRFGYTNKFINSMLDQYHLWESSLDNLCTKATTRKVKAFMRSIHEGEYVEAKATMGEAIHQLILGHQQSLLVTRKGDIIGVLRVTDVFAAVFNAMKALKI